MALTQLTEANVMKAVTDFTAQREQLDQVAVHVQTLSDESIASLQGSAGTAFRQSMQQALESHRKLTQLFQEITDNVQKQSSHLLGSDEDNAQSIQSSLVDLGH